jgi:hypothetical protein
LKGSTFSHILAAMTWVLIIIMIVGEKPVAITSVPGYSSMMECEAAGSKFVAGEKITQRKEGRAEYDCISGPKR